MIRYTFRCHAGSCDALFEGRYSIKDDLPRTCPDCGADALRTVLEPTFILIDATPKTVGSIAERNSGPGRTYWLEKQRHDAEESRRRGVEEINASLPAGMRSARDQGETPFWRGEKVNTGLTRLTPEQALNYVATGDSARAE